MTFNLQLLNLFFGMCRGSHGLPRSLHDLGYIPELVESTFANSEDRPVVPDIVIASAQIHHTVVFEFKSGANTEADQLQRYSVVVPNDLRAKALIHPAKCVTHDVAIIAKHEHRGTIPIGVVAGGYLFPVLVTTATGIEVAHGAFSSAPTDAVFRPLVVDWATLPTTFFPLDADSELWEFAEKAIPYVLEDMAKGVPRIRLDELAAHMIPLWTRMSPTYQTQIKDKIREVMNHAAQVEFSNHLERAPAGGVIHAPHWNVIENPLVGAADKRQRAWKAMAKKHQSLIEYYQNPHRQEVLELRAGDAL